MVKFAWTYSVSKLMRNILSKQTHELVESYEQGPHVFQNNNSAGSRHDPSHQKEGMAKHRNDRWEALQREGFIPENPKLEKWCALSTGREAKCRHTNKNSKNEVQLSLCNTHASSYSSQRLLQTFTLIKYIGQPTVRCLLSENISIENVTEEEVERS